MSNDSTKKKYEDPTIEDLVLDITDYSSIMKANLGDKMAQDAEQKS